MIRPVGIDGNSLCAYASDVALTRDGRIVIAGSIGCGGKDSPVRMLVIRLLADGSLDGTFAGDGTWTSSAGCDAAGVAVPSDGKLLIGGSTRNEFCEHGTMLLLRLHPDGRFDKAFADDGRLRIRFPGVRDARTEALALYPRNRVVLAGSAGRHLGIARVLPNGRPDRAFGTGGRIKAAVARRAVDESASGVAVGPAGRISVAVFTYRRAFQSRFGLLRVRAGGRPDRSWGRDGARILGFGSRDEGAYGVAVDDAGRTIAVGFTRRARTGDDFAVARLR